MPELMTKQDAIEYLLYMKHDVQAKSPMDIALDTAIESLKQPTIEAKPVRHGRWIEKPPYEDETVKGLEFQIVCSECDEQNSSITFDENSVPIEKTFYRTRYCPNCGARMDSGPLPTPFTLGSEANGCWISCAECANTGCKNRYVQEAKEDDKR